MTDLSALDVAAHWPFVRRNLVLDRWPSAERALHALASLQVASGGEAAYLGAGRLRGAGLTDGEARNVVRTLIELAGRDVVIRHPGRGTRPSAWSFRADLRNWRRLPWVTGAPGVEEAVGACFCSDRARIRRAADGLDARRPGHSVALTRGKAVFCLSEADHLLRPGDLPVDTRVKSAGRASNPFGRAWDPVDTRVKSAPFRASLLSSELRTSYVRTDDDDDEGQALQALRAAIRATTGAELYGAPLDRLRALGASVGPDAPTLAALFVQRCANLRSPVAAVDAMGQLWRSGERPPAPREPLDVRITRGEIDRLRGELAVAARLGEAPDAGKEAEIVELEDQLALLLGAMAA